MCVGIGVFLVILTLLATACASGGSTLERRALAVPAAAPCVSTPEEQGMDSSVFKRALGDLGGERRGLHGLLVACRNQE